MKAPRRFTLIFTLASLILLGVALWYFQPHPAPAVAPIAQTKAPAAPAGKPLDAPVAVQQPQSGAGQPASVSTPVLAKTAPASPVAKPLDEPRHSSKSDDGQTPAASPAATLVAADNPAEIAATARMYAAHASLRTPEVADPDSKANKQILQTMVSKALAQHATPPPALSPSNGPTSQQVTSAK